jgi:predicted molibdopterin-dependent oxidoreductase YjgC
MTRRAKALDEHQPANKVQVNPVMAARLNIADGELSD